LHKHVAFHLLLLVQQVNGLFCVPELNETKTSDSNHFVAVFVFECPLVILFEQGVFLEGQIDECVYEGVGEIVQSRLRQFIVGVFLEMLLVDLLGVFDVADVQTLRQQELVLQNEFVVQNVVEFVVLGFKDLGVVVAG